MEQLENLVRDILFNDKGAGFSAEANNVIKAANALEARVERQANALDIAFKQLDTGVIGHSFHKHFHGGCVLCEIEEALKEK